MFGHFTTLKIEGLSDRAHAFQPYEECLTSKYSSCFDKLYMKHQKIKI